MDYTEMLLSTWLDAGVLLDYYKDICTKINTNEQLTSYLWSLLRTQSLAYYVKVCILEEFINLSHS